jgi:hypothetical protein
MFQKFACTSKKKCVESQAFLIHETCVSKIFLLGCFKLRNSL